MNYFILINDVQQGPFTLDELRRRGITQDTLVWCEGMPQWTPAWQVEELKDICMPQNNAESLTPPPVQDRDSLTPPPPPTSGGEDHSGGKAAEKAVRRGKSHHGCLILLVIVVIVLFILALTNPGKAEHRQAILDRLDTATEQVDNVSDPTVRSIISGILGLGNGVMKEAVRQLVDEDLEYHNYIFFSTTTLHSDLLRQDIRTSTGFLGHVSAVNLANVLPEIIMQQFGGTGSGTTETESTTVDSDGNETTETTQTTRRNGVVVDSIARRVTGRIADDVARRVKKEARQQTDSATASGIDNLVDDVLRLIKGQ